MTTIRDPAVAGLFYPAEPGRLRHEIERHLAAAGPAGDTPPKALIVPHAGYEYSGPVAARGYALLHPEKIERVVVLGPAHRFPLRGMATHSADYFGTPLGSIPVERSAVPILDAAHTQEHGLEVHLPFLQIRCGRFRLVPILVGDASPEKVADTIEGLWGGPETLVVISSDLSHFHEYQAARRIDGATAEAITTLHPGQIGNEQACGYRAVNGLLTVARREGLQVRLIDLRNSGDTAGGRDRVVGYATFAI